MKGRLTPMAGASLLFLATACGGSAKQMPPPLATLRALAVLTWERPVNGTEHVFRDPLADYSVNAVGASGDRAKAAVGRQGVAVLHLPAGRYVVTTTEQNACPPAVVTLTPSEVTTLNLHCVAP
jgi:hypothetical protein